jgi:DNA-binding Lrp family transcriptional regulator
MAVEREPLMSVQAVAERLNVSPRSALRLIERREVARRSVVVVGSQVGLGL